MRLVTRGFGPSTGANLLPTRGYATGGTPPPVVSGVFGGGFAHRCDPRRDEAAVFAAIRSFLDRQ